MLKVKFSINRQISEVPHLRAEYEHLLGESEDRVLAKIIS